MKNDSDISPRHAPVLNFYSESRRLQNLVSILDPSRIWTALVSKWSIGNRKHIGYCLWWSCPAQIWYNLVHMSPRTKSYKIRPLPPENGPQKFLESSIAQPQIARFHKNLVHRSSVGPRNGGVHKIHFRWKRDGRQCSDFKWLSRYNSVVDCLIALKLLLCGGRGSIEFVGLCIVGLVIKAQNDWHSIGWPQVSSVSPWSSLKNRKV